MATWIQRRPVAPALAASKAAFATASDLPRLWPFADLERRKLASLRQAVGQLFAPCVATPEQELELEGFGYIVVSGTVLVTFTDCGPEPQLMNQLIEPGALFNAAELLDVGPRRAYDG